MRELIDREQVLKDMGERPKVGSGSGLYALGAVNQYDCDRLAVETAPTVDAVPVKHGRWKEDPSGYGFWICSACGFVSEASAADMLYKFCPVCGAKMDGKDGDHHEG